MDNKLVRPSSLDTHHKLVEERYALNWLSGSTCHRHGRTVHWISESGDHIIMKHHGHSEYVDRMTGTVRCETYYALYDTRVEFPGRLGDGYLKKWVGRWKTDYMAEALSLVYPLKLPES